MMCPFHIYSDVSVKIRHDAESVKHMLHAYVMPPPDCVRKICSFHCQMLSTADRGTASRSLATSRDWRRDEISLHGGWHDYS